MAGLVTTAGATVAVRETAPRANLSGTARASAVLRRLTAKENAFDTLVALVTFALAASGAIGFPLLRLHVAWRAALPSLYCIALLAVPLVYYRACRREPRLEALLRMTLWAVLLSSSYIFPMYIIARLSGELRDDLLASCDRALGVSTSMFVAWAGAHPTIRTVLDASYDSLQMACVAPMLLLPLTGRTRAAKELLVAMVFASVVSLALFALAPAVGPWTGGGFKPQAAQQALSHAYQLLQQRGAYVVNISRLDALIAFPSWHVILAVLAAISLARIPYLAPAAVAWGALVVISTLAMGWHYVTDVLGGLAVSALSYAGALAFSRWEARPPRTPDDAQTGERSAQGVRAVGAR